MLGHLLEPLKRILKKKTGLVESKIQTFTYYIPAPPKRQTGYREKEFDQIFHKFINQGFEIIDIKTQAHNGEQHCGFWFICTVRSTRPETANLDLTIDGPDPEEEYVYDEDLQIIRENS